MTAIQIYTHINKTMISPKHILERLLLIMVNEAARCLEESVVASPALLDMAMIMGTGFPPFRGGLCRYVDEIGADKIVDQLSKLSDQLGERFIPAEGLKALSNSKTKYYSS
jgi:3-hydroxyacyl-CoA dehydrogenase/enoyl-CoA hydratase/3-hydroxybutyryl-CoA epimerase